MDIVSKVVNHNSHPPGNVTTLSGYFSSDPPESFVLSRINFSILRSFPRASPGRVPEYIGRQSACVRARPCVSDPTVLSQPISMPDHAMCEHSDMIEHGGSRLISTEALSYDATHR